MPDRRHRRTHICPQCGHKFKNFKWRRGWKYDGVAAVCPWCKTFAYEWPEIIKKKEVKDDKKET